MLRFKAANFIDTLNALNGSRVLIKKNIENLPEDKTFHNADLTRLRNMIVSIAADAETLGAPLTKVGAERFLHEIPPKDATEEFSRERVLASLDEIYGRLYDEISLVHLFVMDSAQAKYFKTDISSFGQEVSDRLPIAIPDIVDAGTCLACKHGTASVFHSMRVMEAALKALGKLLDIPYAPSWESYISQIEGKITAKHKTKGVQWKRDEPFYREILGNLQTIKIAWRNPTMHIVRRYSTDEAEEIYVAVRAFLKRLAPKLPKPKVTKVGTS